MLALLLATTLTQAHVDLIPKRRTELMLELEAFDDARPSFTPGVVAMGFGVAASLIAAMIESARHDSVILPKEGTDAGICVCFGRVPPGRPTTIELGFAISALVLTAFGSWWELYVGLDRIRTTAERDALLSAISSALP
ncbi:MAG: hypothetical protein QM723_13970 [Myxococcaceae bacterium]